MRKPCPTRVEKLLWKIWTRRTNVVGYLKGKSAIAIARKFRGKQRNFTGENFWARGYFVSTVGLDEEVVRNYIRHQEEQDAFYKQQSLF